MVAIDARAAGMRAVLGTHDMAIIDAMRQHASRRNLPTTAFEVHMLYGIQREAQLRLAPGVPCACWSPTGRTGSRGNAPTGGAPGERLVRVAEPQGGVTAGGGRRAAGGGRLAAGGCRRKSNGSGLGLGSARARAYG